MTRVVSSWRIPEKILVAAACLAACGWTQVSVAWAQRGPHPVGGAHPAGGGRAGGGVRVGAPQTVAPLGGGPRGMVARPHGVGGPGVTAGVAPVSVHGLRFRQGRIGGFRPGLFGPRLFRGGRGLRSGFWWPGCGPAWSWEFGCSGVAPNPSGFENYVAVQSYENPTYVIYGYGPEGRELVWLYLKDGTVYGVSDYWFVNGEVHFKAVGDGGAPSGEQVIGAEELDAQKTSEINTARGFRVVMRDEPWEKYLKDHPDATPAELAPQRKN